MDEPCVICTPLEKLPESLREFLASLPAPDVLKDVPLPEALSGRKKCWNCSGKGHV